MTLIVYSDAGERRVSATQVTPHFAVHRSIENDTTWAVTHIPSGYSAGSFRWRTCARAILVAQDLEKAAVGAGVDWASIAAPVSGKVLKLGRSIVARHRASEAAV